MQRRVLNMAAMNKTAITLPSSGAARCTRGSHDEEP